MGLAIFATLSHAILYGYTAVGIAWHAGSADPSGWCILGGLIGAALGAFSAAEAERKKGVWR